MADDGMSASQLRQRYNKGGTAQDSELSAAQLRSRHGVKNREFSQGGGDNTMMIVVRRCPARFGFEYASFAAARRTPQRSVPPLESCG